MSPARIWQTKMQEKGTMNTPYPTETPDIAGVGIAKKMVSKLRRKKGSASRKLARGARKGAMGMKKY